jgi:Helix-turn-helix domain
MTESITPSELLPLLPELKLFTPREAAQILRCSPGALAVRRHRRKSGLKFLRLGKRIYYRAQDLVEWAEAQLDPGIGPKPVPKRRKKAVRS